MSLWSKSYLELKCDEKLHTNCNISYAGHDSSQIYPEAFKLGWRETEKGHICPTCRIFLNNKEFCTEEQLPETD